MKYDARLNKNLGFHEGVHTGRLAAESTGRSMEPFQEKASIQQSRLQEIPGLPWAAPGLCQAHPSKTSKTQVALLPDRLSSSSWRCKAVWSCLGSPESKE